MMNFLPNVNKDDEKLLKIENRNIKEKNKKHDKEEQEEEIKSQIADSKFWNKKLKFIKLLNHRIFIEIIQETYQKTSGQFWNIEESNEEFQLTRVTFINVIIGCNFYTRVLNTLFVPYVPFRKILITFFLNQRNYLLNLRNY